MDLRLERKELLRSGDPRSKVETLELRTFNVLYLSVLIINTPSDTNEEKVISSFKTRRMTGYRLSQKKKKNLFKTSKKSPNTVLPFRPVTRIYIIARLTVSIENFTL